MKTKILLLTFICFFIFAYCTSPADPEIEKVLNPENPGPPTVSLAEFELTIVPEQPVFTYYPDSDTSKATFTLVITETGGEVGAGFDSKVISFINSSEIDSCYSKHLLEWRTIEASGSVSHEWVLEVPCRPKYVQTNIVGTDNNGISFSEGWDIPFIWAN